VYATAVDPSIISDCYLADGKKIPFLLKRYTQVLTINMVCQQPKRWTLLFNEGNYFITCKKRLNAEIKWLHYYSMTAAVNGIMVIFEFRKNFQTFDCHFHQKYNLSRWDSTWTYKLPKQPLQNIFKCSFYISVYIGAVIHITAYNDQDLALLFMRFEYLLLLAAKLLILISIIWDLSLFITSMFSECSLHLAKFYDRL
jgi:hypothetical protein